MKGGKDMTTGEYRRINMTESIQRKSRKLTHGTDKEHIPVRKVSNFLSGVIRELGNARRGDYDDKRNHTGIEE